MDDTFAFLDDLGGVPDAPADGGGCPPPMDLMHGKRTHGCDGRGADSDPDPDVAPPYAKRGRPAAALSDTHARLGPADPTAGGLAGRRPTPPALPCTPVMGRAAEAAGAMSPPPLRTASSAWCDQQGSGMRWAPCGVVSAAATPVPAASAGADTAGDSVSPTSLFDTAGGDGGSESDTSGGSGRSTGSGRSSGSGRSTSSVLSGRKSNVRCGCCMRWAWSAAVGVEGGDMRGKGRRVRWLRESAWSAR